MNKIEVMFLNRDRAYVRVGETWYDTYAGFYPEVGQPFLTGRVEQVLSYDEFMQVFGKEDIKELYPQVTEKTQSKGFLRKVLSSKALNGDYVPEVIYAVNPVAPSYLSELSDSFN